MEDKIINKVAQSGLVTFDLASIYPEGERRVYDIKDNLFHGLILKEKDFRDFVKNHDWSVYEGAYVAITCTADAIVPTWAYMLLANRMEPYAKEVVFGDLETLETLLFEAAGAAAQALADAKDYTAAEIAGHVTALSTAEIDSAIAAAKNA